MTLEVLLQKSASSFEDSLALQEVGLPKHLDNETYKRTRNLWPVGWFSWYLATVNVSLEATISNIKLSDDLVLDELESQKFMRTKSTQTLKDKAPKAKWDGMMSMFKEWKHHNTVAEGQQVYDLSFIIALRSCA